MTNDPVDAVVLAFLEYLDGTGPEPSLDHLTLEERALAQELIDSASVGRGIDPYESRPSISSLLAGSDLEHWLAPPETVGLSIDAIRTEVISALGAAALPIEDGAALSEGIRSNAVILFRAMRLRVQFRDDITTAVALSEVDPRVAGGPVFGRFPDTAGLILVIGDEELSSVPIGPLDTDDYIGAPDGHLYPPHIRRPILPLFDTLRSYVDAVAPDLAATSEYQAPDPVDMAATMHSATDAAIEAIVSEGSRARTEAKKSAWCDGVDAAHEFVSGIVAEAWDHPVGIEDLRAKLETAVAAA